jgi:hypothetical protein
MLLSAIKNLERACLILNDIPKTIEKERLIVLSAINDLFEDFQDQFSGDEKTLKKISTFKKDIFKKVESFCDAACESVKEDVRIVEE